MRKVAIIQARMGSTRLPGKVLADLAGEPMLVRVVQRVQRARTLDDVVVATTVQITDEPIVRLCEQKGWFCFRGSEDDVLDRFYQASIARNADVVVRITSDCPLIEPELIDSIIYEFLNRQPVVQYVSNTLPPRTFPRGLDVESIRFDALKQAWRLDRNPAWREHVTPFIYRNPDIFHIYSIRNEVDYSHMRWTVDTLEDMTLVRRIYEYFGCDTFSWKSVLELLEDKPEWMEINRYVRQKEVL